MLLGDARAYPTARFGYPRDVEVRNALLLLPETNNVVLMGATKNATSLPGSGDGK